MRAVKRIFDLYDCVYSEVNKRNCRDKKKRQEKNGCSRKSIVIQGLLFIRLFCACGP